MQAAWVAGAANTGKQDGLWRLQPVPSWVGNRLLLHLHNHANHTHVCSGVTTDERGKSVLVPKLLCRDTDEKHRELLCYESRITSIQ